MAADFADYFFDHLRLHANDDDVGILGGFDVAGPDFHFHFFGECFCAIGMGDRCRGGLRREQAMVQERLQYDSAHLAGA